MKPYGNRYPTEAPQVLVEAQDIIEAPLGLTETFPKP